MVLELKKIAIILAGILGVSYKVGASIIKSGILRVSYKVGASIINQEFLDEMETDLLIKREVKDYKIRLNILAFTSVLFVSNEFCRWITFHFGLIVF